MKWIVLTVLLVSFFAAEIPARASVPAAPVAADSRTAETPFDFTNVIPVRPRELTVLEERTKALEWQMQNEGRPTPPDEETRLRVKLKLAELYSQLPRATQSLDDGADACPAVTLPAGIAPYTDYGTTIGAVNNFNPINPCGTTFAPDKIYRYVPGHSGYFAFDTFGSDFDTQLYINTGGACPGNTQLVCNDDFGGSQSRVTLFMYQDQVYYIIVDGFQGYSGNFVLNLSGDCAIGNNPAWQQECVEVPGDPSHAMFDCNGGCNNGYYGGMPAWQGMNHCQFLRGTCFTYLDPGNIVARDTDAYYFTLTEPCSLSLNLFSTFSYNVIITDYGMCLPTPFFSLLNIPACNGGTAITPCLPVGTYSISIVPNFYTNMPEPLPYFFSVELIPCSGCRVDGEFIAPSSFLASGCAGGSQNSLRPSAEATYCVVIPHASDWTFSVCGSSLPWNSYLYITSECNGGIIAEDNDGCSTNGLSKIECLSLMPGNYYVTIEGYYPADCDQFYMTVTECVGSCCYGDMFNPSCSFGPRSACDALSGNFTLNQPCTPGLCYIRPACDEGSIFSQQPHVPDEMWSAFASDNYQISQVWEDYSVSSAIGSLRFWGLSLDYNNGLACTEQPGTFEITFVDSTSGPAVQSYIVSAYGLPILQNYGANYVMTEYNVDLPSPCMIQSGRLSIRGFDNDPCIFHWATSPQGNGSVVMVNSGGHVNLPRDMAVCLGEGCPAPDSVVIRPTTPDTYEIWFHVPQSSFVKLYYSTDINAVFPATYSVLISGSLTPGNWYGTDLAADPQRRYVLTAQCGPPPVSKDESGRGFQPRE